MGRKYESRAAERNGTAMSKAEWMSGKYGVMVHYLSHILSEDGTKKLSPNEMADNFNVKEFVKSIKRMGASWVIFPIGQNTGFYWSENPYIEKLAPGHCANRDLISDIAEELNAEDIRFIAYLPTEADAQSEEMRKAFGWDLSADKKEFMKRYIPIVRYYAEKFGDKLSGWWFDGNYKSSEKSFLRTHDWDNGRFDKAEWFAAAKAGNPEAAIAMCTGANHMGYVFEEEEYLPGETNDLTHFPWEHGSREKQWHVLTWLDCFWMYSEGKMPPLKYSNKALYEYVRKCTDKKGAVTLNIGIYEDGTLAEEAVRQVGGLRTALAVENPIELTNIYGELIKKFEIHTDSMKNEMPYEVKACGDGMYAEKGPELSNMWNWTTSFVTGLAPMYYQVEKTEKYLKWANAFEKYYHAKMFDTPLESMHDIGFLYSPYSVAMYKLTGDMAHRNDALRAADELAKRFDINGRYIDAWGRMNDDGRTGRAIIDCMMNIALLMWAFKETGHTYYRDIAKAHADTTRKYFIRDDFSVAHSFDFDRKTGEVLRENNGCGYSNGSWWARGTAWAIYGFALIGRYEEEYARLSEKIAKAYMSQLEKDKYVPVWDFRLPKDMPAKKCGTEPADWDETDARNKIYNADTSAAAISACGMLTLYELGCGTDMLSFAVKTLEVLSAEYVSRNVNVPGILKYQNGQKSYTAYGDYFYAELLLRILYNIDICW